MKSISYYNAERFLREVKRELPVIAAQILLEARRQDLRWGPTTCTDLVKRMAVLEPDSVMTFELRPAEINWGVSARESVRLLVTFDPSLDPKSYPYSVKISEISREPKA